MRSHCSVLQIVLRRWLGINIYFFQLPSLYVTRRLQKGELLEETAALNPILWEAQPDPLVWVLVK